MLAPGNVLCAATLPPSDPLDRLSAVLGLAGRLFDAGWVAPLALLALPLLLAPAQAREALGALRRPAIWVLPACALLYIALHLALPAPTLAPRLGFPASVALAGFLFLLFRERPRDGWSERILAGTIGFAAPRLAALSAIGADWRVAASSKESGDAVLPERRFEESLVRARGPVFFVGLERDPAKGYNACFARAHGLDTVRVAPD